MEERSSMLTEYYHVHPKKGCKGAKQCFWPAETPTHELGWSQLNLDQLLKLAYMLIWSELVLMSTRISGNTNPPLPNQAILVEVV
jgi:hypothetical protein